MVKMMLFKSSWEEFWKDVGGALDGVDDGGVQKDIGQEKLRGLYKMFKVHIKQWKRQKLCREKTKRVWEVVKNTEGDDGGDDGVACSDDGGAVMMVVQWW